MRHQHQNDVDPAKLAELKAGIGQYLKENLGKPPREQFAITLRSEPGWNVSPDIRLRGALKDLLRRWGLKCVTVAPVVDKLEGQE